MNQDVRIAKLAMYEIGWWKAHHRKDKEDFVFQMTMLYMLQFGISEESAQKAVWKRKEAADFHDIAEKYEDKGQQIDADKYWDKAKESLREHFELLYKVLNQHKGQVKKH